MIYYDGKDIMPNHELSTLYRLMLKNNYIVDVIHREVGHYPYCIRIIKYPDSKYVAVYVRLTYGQKRLRFR
jgi:hypothetical protein